MKKIMMICCLLGLVSTAAMAQAKASSDEKAGYLNPEGTFFLGMDEKGKGEFMKTGGIVGSSVSDVKAWVWRNTTTGSYKSISYKTQLNQQYPSYCEEENYFVDKNGNFCDSIVAEGGWDEAYSMGSDGDEGLLWQMAIPAQTVVRSDGSKQLFQLLSTSGFPSASTCGYAVGSLPSSKSSDGLWPLTNAVCMSKAGTSFLLNDGIEADGLVKYYFGSDDLVINGTRVTPVTYVTHYDKPQSKLYVKNITLALGANGYSAFKKDTLKLGTLTATVKDASGVVIATSTATSANLSSMSYKAGQMLTFPFQTLSAYGELLSEGFTVEDAFTVEISGMTSDQEFGIYAAASTVYDSKTDIVCSDGVTRKISYDPYIMLNGIMPRLEDYYVVGGSENLPVHGDTTNIAFIPATGNTYSWTATYDKSGFTTREQQFAYYSTFAPYDSDTKLWNLDIIRPDYVVMEADHEFNVSGDDDDPTSFWDYKRAFTLYIHATQRPVVGDCITMGKAGKNMVFKITNVDGFTALDELDSSSLQEGQVRKFIKDGRVYIQKNGVIYDIMGNRVK